MPQRLPIVGVMGSGVEPHEDKAAPLGAWLGARCVHLLTGGGGGVMTSVSRAFSEVPGRIGMVIGVLPSQASSTLPKAGYPNPWVELPIQTHLPLSGESGLDARSRNHINVLSSTVLVALPGAAGTASEVELALAYGRPVVAFVDVSEQIPGLDARVPIARDLHDVCAFIDAALAAWSA